jgi:hypothetical protein
MGFWENVFFSPQFVVMCVSLGFVILLLDELGFREHTKAKDYVRAALVIIGLGVSTAIWLYLLSVSLGNFNQG